jgi:hypothetical protein
MANQYTKRQHIVPQFLLRYFDDSSGLVSVIDKQNSPYTARDQSPKGIFAENDMYETKNIDGSYFERNFIENHFACMEGHISGIIKSVSANADESLVLSGEDDAALAQLIALQLVRLPIIKKVLCNNPKGRYTSDKEKELYDNATYRMLLFSDKSGFDYLEENGLALSDWAKDEVKGKNLLSHVASFILDECAIYIAKAEKGSHFIITDNPVLIDAFPDAKYVFPISPQLSVCCCLWEQAKGKQDGGCIEINAEGVQNINRLLIEKANRWVVCSRVDADSVIKNMRLQNETKA